MAGTCERIRGSSVTIMEICGSHTHVIAKYGLRQLVPDHVRFVSGPGCPVCVTSPADIDEAIACAKAGATVAIFGDMIRVPGSYGSLAQERAAGGDIRIVYSPLAALKLAQDNPHMQVVFVATGFETTAPGIALTVVQAHREKVKNFFVLSLLKTMPAVLRFLLATGSAVDAFLLPGHVCTVIGIEPFLFLAQEFQRAAVISGFTPEDILASVKMLEATGWDPKVTIQYRRAVRPAGNRTAQQIINKIFSPSNVSWRGFGVIPQSGLKLNKEWAPFDVRRKYRLAATHHRPEEDCDSQSSCAAVLKGLLSPVDCSFFGTTCQPENPRGPSMVSAEGACAAYFTYGGREYG